MPPTPPAGLCQPSQGPAGAELPSRMGGGGRMGGAGRSGGGEQAGSRPGQTGVEAAAAGADTPPASSEAAAQADLAQAHGLPLDRPAEAVSGPELSVPPGDGPTPVDAAGAADASAADTVADSLADGERAAFEDDLAYGFLPGHAHTLESFERYALFFKRKFFSRGAAPVPELSVEEVEGEFWRLVEQRTCTKPVEARGAAPAPGAGWQGGGPAA